MSTKMETSHKHDIISFYAIAAWQRTLFPHDVRNDES